MAVLMQWLIDAAATNIGDPNKSRVQQPQWNTIATLSLDAVCSKYDVLEYEDGFDLPADGLVTYPDACTRVSEVRVSTTPLDDASFERGKLGELFEDEWNLVVRGGLPVGSQPARYFADKGFIRLDARLAADVVNGGRIWYYAVPPPVVDATTYTVPLPDFFRTYFVERLEIGGLFADERTEEAVVKLRVWDAREDEIRTKIEHRSVDRRESLRPTSARGKYSRMS